MQKSSAADGNLDKRNIGLISLDYTSGLNLDFERIEVFSVLQQISFTSYGRDTFSSISLLIDSLCVQKDMYSKSLADFALVTFVQNLRLTEKQTRKITVYFKI